VLLVLASENKMTAKVPFQVKPPMMSPFYGVSDVLDILPRKKKTISNGFLT
jgi:hypothetical protein